MKTNTQIQDQMTGGSRAASHSIQPRLKISKPGDRLEKEADEVASRVVNRKETPMISGIHEKKLQRQPMEEEEEMQAKLKGEMIQRQPLEEEEEELQPKLSSGAPGVDHATSMQQELKSTGSGSPLPSSTRSFMEKGIGADFRSVRVHNDSRSHKMADSIQAQAFTHGRNIYFNKGKWNPASKSGQELLAHELTHVVQQNDGIQRKAIVKNDQGNEKQQVESALDKAGVMVDKAQKYIGGNKRGRYKLWFDKKYDPSKETEKNRFKDVKWGWIKVHSVFKSKDIEFDCSARNESWFAEVHTGDTRYSMKLGKDFWSAPLTGRDSKGGTIVHEISHEEMYTDDHKYGEDKAKKLAESKPGDAMDNADNWEYFAEDSY